MPKIEFIEEGHKYFVDGKEVDSVNKILELAGIKNTIGYSPETSYRGRYFHRAAHLLLLGRLNEATVKPEFRGYIAGFKAFLSEHRVKPIKMEFKVYSPFPAPYAGTLDYFGYMDGKVSLIDWKTGALSEPDSWIKLQLAGYERAKPRNLKQTEKFYVVKFDKDGNYRIYEIQIGAIELEDFDSLVRAHHVRQRYL